MKPMTMLALGALAYVGYTYLGPGSSSGVLYPGGKPGGPPIGGPIPPLPLGPWAPDVGTPSKLRAAWVAHGSPADKNGWVSAETGVIPLSTAQLGALFDQIQDQFSRGLGWPSDNQVIGLINQILTQGASP